MVFDSRSQLVFDYQLGVDIVHREGPEFLEYALPQQQWRPLAFHHRSIHVMEDSITNLDLFQGNHCSLGYSAISHLVVLLPLDVIL